MKSSTRLDSAVFQLTPTRTRCDLVISANGETEKMASGLLNPFLAHLKTAQDQIAKGGYSIILEPENAKDATWFTKGTVERFVRFVSTPEVLERLYTLESEILQIEEELAIQSNNETGLSTVEEIISEPVESIKGSGPSMDTGEEESKPGAHPPEANGSAVQEENSKVQLLKILETRTTVLKKVQGMAFARAVAAGFDVDNVTLLISFAESFGASRLMDACVRFVELWKSKHETGQWLEIEEAVAMSSKPDFSATNASGIILHENENPPVDHQPPGEQEYLQGQFRNQMLPAWPIQSPPGAPPVFQGYPIHGMPYYKNYPANGPHFQSPSVMDDMKARSQYDEELGKVTSSKKASRAGKKKSGVVLIRNINYITSKRQSSSPGESQLVPNSEPHDEDEDIGSRKKLKGTLRSSKRKDSNMQSMDDMEGTANRKQGHGGEWQAFQNLLLGDADEEEHAVDKGIFAMEKDIRARRLQNTVGDDDPLIFNGQGRVDQSGDGGGFVDGQMDTEINSRSVNRTKNDDLVIQRQEDQSGTTNSPSNMLAVNKFERPTNNSDGRSLQKMDDDSHIVSLRSLSPDHGGTDVRDSFGFPALHRIAENKSNGNQVNYEPGDFSLMEPEKGSTGYDPALEHETQAHVKEAVNGVKQALKKSDKDPKSKLLDKKTTGGLIRKMLKTVFCYHGKT